MSTPAGRRSPHGWQIGSLAGSPVYLGRSWPVIAVVIVVVFGPNLARPDRGPEYGYLAAAGYALLLLLSVLVHEAAHALAARWRGHPVDRIVADVWGGHTVYDATRTSPGSTALIAVVGPLANLALAVVGLLLQSVTTNDTALLLLTIITYANLLVGLFNLLARPAPRRRPDRQCPRVARHGSPWRGLRRRRLAGPGRGARHRGVVRRRALRARRAR